MFKLTLIRQEIRYAERDRYTLNDITTEYDHWVTFDKYLILTRRNNYTYETSTLGIKCSKRGNEIYAKRTLKRFLTWCKRIPNVTFYHPYQDNKTTQALFITLTYDTKLCDYRTAWERIAKEWNLFMSNMRKQYGRIATIRCFESFTNGHPHIHAILFFKDHTFKVCKCHTPDMKKEYLGTTENVTIETYWHSMIVSKAVDELASAIQYLTKYLTKAVDYAKAQDEKQEEADKIIKTLALTWLFNKRAFSITNPYNVLELEQAVLKQAKAHLKPVFLQTDLDGDTIPMFSYIVHGIVDGLALDLTEEQQKRRIIELDEEQIKNVETIFERKSRK